ncbi:glycosyltransferase family 2 protein [Adlercreutzia faecimuris]|uniref:glycosyltransferase family 2 protein n=1 Tax=Adlercreutzia faecimuris TaxID=2897341 RepID=UPI002412CD7C|nr:glycosyltransferase family 2 protein [Adlercreutzia sp. JBNU-10]
MAGSDCLDIGSRQSDGWAVIISNLSKTIRFCRESPDQEIFSETTDFSDKSFSPLVTVVITTYGDCSTLLRAIESVLKQSYKSIEIIVVDDNGDRGMYRKATEKIMGRYEKDRRIRYICHPKNLNGSAARNTGIGHSNGKYLTFLDNDDFMLSDRIANAVKTLEEVKADAYFCDVLLMAQGRYAKVHGFCGSELVWKDLLFSASCMGTGSNLFLRRSAIDETGSFDTSFKRNQDVEYMLRFLLNHKSIWRPDLDLVKGESATSNEQSYESYAQTKAHFDVTFASLISSLDEEEEKKRLVCRETELLSVAIRSCNERAVQCALKRLADLGRPVGMAQKAMIGLKCKRRHAPLMIEKLMRLLRHYSVRRRLSASDRISVSELASLAVTPEC